MNDKELFKQGVFALFCWYIGFLVVVVVVVCSCATKQKMTKTEEIKIEETIKEAIENKDTTKIKAELLEVLKDSSLTEIYIKEYKDSTLSKEVFISKVNKIRRDKQMSGSEQKAVSVKILKDKLAITDKNVVSKSEEKKGTANSFCFWWLLFLLAFLFICYGIKKYMNNKNCKF